MLNISLQRTLELPFKRLPTPSLEKDSPVSLKRNPLYNSDPISPPIYPIKSVSTEAILSEKHPISLPQLTHPIPAKHTFFSTLSTILLSGMELCFTVAKIVYDVLSKSVPIEDFIRGSLRAVKTTSALSKLSPAIHELEMLSDKTSDDDAVIEALRFVRDQNKIGLKDSLIQAAISGGVLAVELAAFLTTAIGGIIIMVLVGIESAVVTGLDYFRAYQTPHAHSGNEDLRLKAENAILSPNVSPTVYAVLDNLGLRGDDSYMDVHNMVMGFKGG